MRRLVWVVLGVVSLVAGGCSSSGGEDSVRAEEGGGTNVPALVSCGGDTAFPASALDGPTGVETEEGPVGDALRTLLDGYGPELGGPATGWRTLLEEDDVVLLGAGDPPAEVFTVALEPEGDGWSPGPFGGCTLRPYREGFEPATWELAAEPSGHAGEVEVLVTETGCASGQEPGDRLQPADVAETDEAVTIAFWVVPAEGDQTCPGNPAVPVTVAIDAALGARALLDGGVFPSREELPGSAGGPEPSVTEPDEPTPSSEVGAGDPTETTGSVPGDAGPAGDQAAAAEIDAAFHTAFDAEVPEQDRFAAVEDGEALAEAGREAAARFPTAAASISVVVHQIAVDGDRATVAFELVYDDAMALGVQQGEAVLVDGAWKVGRETRCAIIRQAGVDCP